MLSVLYFWLGLIDVALSLVLCTYGSVIKNIPSENIYKSSAERSMNHTF